jgi:hypothetical protein
MQVKWYQSQIHNQYLSARMINGQSLLLMDMDPLQPLSPLSSPYFLISLLLFYAREDPKVYDDDAMQYTLMLYSFLHYTFNLTCQVSLDIRKYIKLRLRGGCSIFLQLS